MKQGSLSKQRGSCQYNITQQTHDYAVNESDVKINRLPQNKKVNIKPKEKASAMSEFNILDRCFTEQRRNSVTEASINEQQDQIPSYCLKWLLSKYKRSEFPDLQRHYQKMKQIKAEQDTIIQIDKDLSRTIKSENKQQQIKNILLTYSVYDPLVGYVQGMNCIASVLLNHTKQEWAAFWLFVSLMEQLEVRDLFQMQQSSIIKYSRMMEYLIYRYLPQIYQTFKEKQIYVQLFLSQWLLSLLFQFIPYEQTKLYIEGLLIEGICYFYKTCLTILKGLQVEIIQEEQIEILMLLTSKQYSNLKWNSILQLQWEIPKGQIRMILDWFDSDRMEFHKPTIYNKNSIFIEQFFKFIIIN